MAKVRFNFVTVDHINALADNMRQSDIDEIALFYDGTLLDVIMYSINMSHPNYLLAALAEDRLICIFGCTHLGNPWLLATDEISKYSKSLMTWAKKMLPMMSKEFPRLSNYIDASNQTTQKWLTALGFKIMPKPVFYKPGLPVLKFEMVNDMNQLDTYIPDTGLNFREAIVSAQDLIKDLPQTPLPLNHHFSDGVYAREIFMPAGTVVIGRIHKTEHLCCMFGDVDIADEHGGKKRLSGYHVFNSLPGTKRILYIHADTCFTTFHKTEETDIDKLEAMLACDTYEQYEQHILTAEQQKLAVAP